MRKLNELYKSLRKYVSNNKWFFICNEIHSMYSRNMFSKKEFNALMKHLDANRPSENQHTEFYNEEYDGLSWWYSKDYESRLRFIDKMIKITSTKKGLIIDLYENETISYDLIAHKCECEVSYVKSVIKKHENK